MTFTATVRNLLVMSSVFSVLTGVILLITSVMLLDALRKEQETAFKGKFELYNRTALYCTYVQIYVDTKQADGVWVSIS